MAVTAEAGNEASGRSVILLLTEISDLCFQESDLLTIQPHFIWSENLRKYRNESRRKPEKWKMNYELKKENPDWFDCADCAKERTSRLRNATKFRGSLPLSASLAIIWWNYMLLGGSDSGDISRYSSSYAMLTVERDRWHRIEDFQRRAIIMPG
jgi:hypothetical protein